ncbi:MAG: cysteine desulfurase [Thermoguttaceae bacterium]|nr:cysteine desulfurase [Thermoguttaceae bacterium]
MKPIVYVDAAATTPLSEFAFNRALPFLREDFGNASSRHSHGVTARQTLEESRRTIGETLGARSEEIVFTSGASEANAWILNAIAAPIVAAPAINVKDVNVVSTAFEHSSIWETLRSLERRGVAVTYLRPNRDGVISTADVAAALRPNTRLVSIMTANNELGTLQPIAEIGRLLRERGVVFHTDATQAVGHIPLNVNELNIDFLTASAHKFNGPKGFGFLYRRHDVDLPAFILGGSQERGLRSGTENIFGAVATAAALTENVAALPETTARLCNLENALLRRLREVLSSSDFSVVGESAARLPGFLNLVFNGADGDTMTRLLDLRGVCASTGSACSSGDVKPSRTLLATGRSELEARSSVRVSFGRSAVPDDAVAVADARK